MTDITINPGVRGHTRSTWRKETHLRGVLLRLITQHPNASRDELEAMYLAKTRRVPALVDEALRRALDNDLAQIRRTNHSPHLTASTVAAAAERLTTVILLDLVQPNGKPLRDCTGRDCRNAGGWLVAIADRIGDRAVVGRKLNEADVAAIFARGA